MWREVFKMIRKEQERFYKMVGKALTSARQRRNISIAELAKLSGEQNKTIRYIEKGNCCYLHHLVWMSELLDINFAKIVKDFERGHGKKSKESFDIKDII
jgi:ribosome-binding protein aMBF1 (putative translation factor)